MADDTLDDQPENQPDAKNEADAGTKPATDPKAELKALLVELDAKNGKLEDLNEDCTKLKADCTKLKAQIDSLKPIVAELDSAGTAFGKAAASVGEDVERFNKYLSDKTKMVGIILGEKTKEIDTAIADVKAKIDGAQEEVTKAAKAVKEADDASQTAENNVKQTAAAYGKLKALPVTLTENVGQLKAQDTKIEEYDHQLKRASMYVYLKEMAWLLDQTKIIPQAEYEKLLNAAQDELKTAKAKAVEKGQKLADAKEKLKKSETDYEALKKSRVEDTLKKVEDLNKVDAAVGVPA